MKRSLGSRDEASEAPPPGKAAKGGGKKGGQGPPRRRARRRRRMATKAAAAVGVGSDRTTRAEARASSRGSGTTRRARRASSRRTRCSISSSATRWRNYSSSSLHALAERTQMQETRGRETVERWCALLRIARTTPVEQAVEQAAELEDEQAELAREVLFENQRKLAAVRASMLSGMPSDERSELVHSMWENAVLRAEVHACHAGARRARPSVASSPPSRRRRGGSRARDGLLLTELGRGGRRAQRERGDDRLARAAVWRRREGRRAERAGGERRSPCPRPRHNASRFGHDPRRARDARPSPPRARVALRRARPRAQRRVGGRADGGARALVAQRRRAAAAAAAAAASRAGRAAPSARSPGASTSIGSKRKDADGGDEIRL